MTTNDWITDRPPAVADADEDGEVQVLYTHSGNYERRPWHTVSPNVSPWRHTNIWQPPATPAPTKPALAVGQRWRRRDGEVVRVFRGSNGFRAGRWSYDLDGTAPFGALGTRPQYDLIELLSPEPTPAPRKFKETPRRTVMSATIHTIDAIDEDGVAWWMITSPDGPEPEWHQLTPLPGREVKA